MKSSKIDVILSIFRSVNLDIEAGILKCGVNHQQESKSLVLSWFYNQDPTPFLMWRFGDNHPDILGRMFPARDLQFKVKTMDTWTETTVDILAPDVSMSGTYTCMVHDSNNIDLNTARSGNMMVFKPPESTSLHQVI